MSEDPNFNMEWHKGFQIGLYSGIDTERERICKILEKYATRQCDSECGYSCECFGKYEAVHFIERIRETALIKGEQK